MSALAAGERKGPVELKRCSRTVTPYVACTAPRARLASAPRDTRGGKRGVQGGRRRRGRRMRAVSASEPRRPGGQGWRWRAWWIHGGVTRAGRVAGAGRRQRAGRAGHEVSWSGGRISMMCSGAPQRGHGGGSRSTTRALWWGAGADASAAGRAGAAPSNSRQRASLA